MPVRSAVRSVVMCAWISSQYYGGLVREEVTAVLVEPSPRLPLGGARGVPRRERREDEVELRLVFHGGKDGDGGKPGEEGGAGRGAGTYVRVLNCAHPPGHPRPAAVRVVCR
ncbi:MAG: hypothetical protein AAGG01_22365, partial [Planctomycetota bacterium]